jgi:uncharacterized protein DUF5362
MESTTESHLFELQVDQNASVYLGDSAKWAKFLAIAGFIFCGLFVVVAVLALTILSSLFNSVGASGVGGMGGGAIAIIYISIGVLDFFPCLYLYKFAARMQTALRTNDQERLNSSFRNMRAFYRFVGVIMIIGLLVWLLGILILAIFSVGRTGV